MTTPRTTSGGPAGALPTSWQRLPALSGIAFAVLFVVGWFISGSDAPDYMAADQEWTNWAENNESKSRIGGFLILIAGFVFLHCAGTIRSLLGTAEARVRGSVQLARVAFAGALTGITGITMAVIMIAGATAEGAAASPMVTRAVATATVGPFLLAAMGFAALLAAAGLVTLRSGVLARWTSIVALLGAVAFFITFLTLLAGPSEDSVFGYGYFVGVLALAIWAIATSIARYRAVATNARRDGGSARGRLQAGRTGRKHKRLPRRSPARCCHGRIEDLIGPRRPSLSVCGGVSGMGCLCVNSLLALTVGVRAGVRGCSHERRLRRPRRRGRR
jgi:succinate dehydrogenase/fumarate reductase cytochrome b subunit